MAEKQKDQQVIDVRQLRQLYSMEKKKLRQLLQRQRLINQLGIENDNTLLAAREISKGKEHESIIPLGSGIFVDAKINSASLKRSLPGNVVVSATIDRVEKDLVGRIEVLGKEGELVHNQITEARTNVRSLTTLLKIARNERAKMKK